MFLRERNFTEFLSEIKRDESGLITGASAAIINWISTMNMREALNNSVVYGPEPITAKTYAFEGRTIHEMLSRILNFMNFWLHSTYFLPIQNFAVPVYAFDFLKLLMIPRSEKISKELSCSPICSPEFQILTEFLTN